MSALRPHRWGFRKMAEDPQEIAEAERRVQELEQRVIEYHERLAQLDKAPRRGDRGRERDQVASLLVLFGEELAEAMRRLEDLRRGGAPPG